MINLQRIMALRPKLGERGIAAVEMALIAPVFVGMLYGFFDFTTWS
jgi:Flp pilus assembly protein TadG